MELQETTVYGMRVRVRELASEDLVELVALAVHGLGNRRTVALPHDGEGENYDTVYRITSAGPSLLELEFLYRESREGPHEGWNCNRWYKPFLCRHSPDSRRFTDFRARVNPNFNVEAFCYTNLFQLRCSPRTLLGKHVSEFFSAELASAVLDGLMLAEPGGDSIQFYWGNIPGLPAAWIGRRSDGGAELRMRTTFSPVDIAMAVAPERLPRPIRFRAGKRNGLRLAWSQSESEASRWFE